MALSLFLVACSTSSNGNGNNADGEDLKVIKYAKQAPGMTTIDAQLSTTSDVIQPARLITESLLTFDADRNLVPLLAEDLPETEDNITFKVKLKEGIKFHDGSELTTEDVKFTFERLYDPATTATNTFIADMIKGAKEKLNGAADEIEGIRIIDDYNMEFELESAFAPFSSVLASEMTVIYPKEATEAAGATWGIDAFVGTGPYVFDEFVPEDYLKTVKNEDYHNGEVSIDELYVYNMDENTLAMEYEAGNINYAQIPNKMAQSYSSDDFADELIKVDLMGIVEVVFNTTIEPLNDVNVRRAISLAVDKPALVNSFLQGQATPAGSAIPRGLIGHTERTVDTYDPETAKELLAEAGYPEGITVDTYVIEGNETADAAVVLQEQMKAAGINLNINLVDMATYLEYRNNGEIPLVFRTWYKDYPDPDNFLYTFFHSAATPDRQPDWGKPETDALISEGRALSAEERPAHYEKIDQILVEDEVAAIPLYYPVFHFLKNPSIEGVNSNDGLLDFTHAELVNE